MASSQRVFHQLAARAGMMTAAPAGVALWAIGPLGAAGVGAAVAGAELWRVRAAVRSGVPDELTFVPSRPADHPWLDADAFRDALTDLEDAGFAPVADYGIEYPGAPDGLARVLTNADQRVYAEVNQVRHNGQVTPVTTTMTSLLDEGWSLQTTSQEPLPVAVAFTMRSRRAVWRALPLAPATELLADHLAVRARMATDLGVGIAGDGTLDGYFALQQSAHEAQRASLRRTNVLRGIARGLAAERRPRRQWFGEYSPAQPV